RLVSQRRSGATSFHHYDALGSTDRLTDSSENTDISYLYKAFGQQTVLSGSHANPFTWVGRLGYYRQKDPSDYWLRARVYDPQLGRFISRDATEHRENPYALPGSAPLLKVDPSGLGWEDALPDSLECPLPRRRGIHRRPLGQYVLRGTETPGVFGAAHITVTEDCPNEPGWYCEGRSPFGRIWERIEGAGGEIII
ncbi:MAG: hypothetical protein GTO22_26520, partial [Gemmatimonadales bacterium]|nr:hypothetical protein [Gemmatimonadales bacterium]